MTTTLQELGEQIQNAAAAGRRLIPRGAGSKWSFENVPVEEQLDGTKLGVNVVRYEPREFTVSVGPGTPVEQLQAILEENEQYLPFDPLLAKQGATIGGTVAAGANGSCRLRYGGIRDFILGVQFIDGLGNIVRSGGKVVKNSAGFDLSKFFVGSCGQFGLFTELTFKVFPRPQKFLTACIEHVEPTHWQPLINRLTRADIELDAIDVCENGKWLVRVGGTSNVADEISKVLTSLLGEYGDVETSDSEAEANIWQAASALEWANGCRGIFKVPITCHQIVNLHESFVGKNIRHRFVGGGNAVLAGVADEATRNVLQETLAEHSLAGQMIRGNGDVARVGKSADHSFVQRIKSVLDPNNVFGSIEP